MIKMTILYYRPDDPEAFEKHYMEKHLPLARQIPGLRRIEVGPLLTSPKGGPDYFWSAECYFDSLAELEAGFGSSAGQAAGKDVANFAPKGNIRFISEVR